MALSCRTDGKDRRIPMTTEEIEKKLSEKMGAKVRETSVKSPMQMFVTVDRDDLLEAMRVLKNDVGLFHLSTITARDTGDRLEALYHLAMEGMELTVRAP